MENIIGIQINIPKNFSNTINSAKKKIRLEYASNYNYEPHITVYLAKFPKNKFDTLIKKINSIKPKTFKIKLDKIKIDHDNKNKKIFFYLDLKKSTELYNLHRKILKTVNDLRDNSIRIKDQKKIKLGKFSKLEIQYIKKYGYLRVLRFYKPHITLGAIPESSQKITVIKKHLNKRLKNIKGKTFLANNLTVGLYILNTKRNRYLKNCIEKDINFTKWKA